jgi:hypothetical protein
MNNMEVKMSVSMKWFRVRVTDLRTGKSKANVRIPASLASFGMKMAAKYAPDSVEGLDMDELFAAAKNGDESKLIDVEDEEKGEHIEIFVE